MLLRKSEKLSTVDLGCYDGTPFCVFLRECMQQYPERGIYPRDGCRHDIWDQFQRFVRKWKLHLNLYRSATQLRDVPIRLDRRSGYYTGGLSIHLVGRHNQQ
jgi:hypothetical protein